MRNTAVLSNYNPTTRTYFKCSIYSPSNRLFTVDEVNSTFSGDNHHHHQNNSHNSTAMNIQQFTKSVIIKAPKFTNSEKS